MDYKSLAVKLIGANGKDEINALLSGVTNDTYVKIAFALKDYCYNSWTKEPNIARSTAVVLEHLLKKYPSKRINALSEWISGISDITQGEITSSIQRLTNASDIFFGLDEAHLAAQTYVAKLYALALLGHYDDAVKCGKEALQIFAEHGDELAAGKIENNLGNIFWRRELHKTAEKYFLSARNRFIKLDDLTQLTMIEHCLATSYTYQDDFRKAEKFYARALERAEKADMFVTRAEIEASIGNLWLSRGRFGVALKYLELSRQKYKKLEMPHQTAVAELEIAGAYLELNLAKEAFETYKTLVDTLANLGMQGEEAKARANFGRAAILLGEEEVAENELRKSAGLYRAEKNRVGVSFIKLLETQLSLLRSEYRKSLRLSKEAIALFNDNGNIRHRLMSEWCHGESLLYLESYEESAYWLKKVFREAIKFQNPQAAQLAQISLGKLAQRTGRIGDAEGHYKKAIKLIETLRNPLPAEEFRVAFLADKLVPYKELAKIYIERNSLSKAFTYVEKSRSRALGETLNSEINDTARRPRGTSDLAEKLANAREELNWFYNRDHREEIDPSSPVSKEIYNKEREVSELTRQISNTSGFGLTSETDLDIEALQSNLGQNQVLIEFIVSESKIAAFVLAEEGLFFEEAFSDEDKIVEFVEGLQFQFGTLRYGGEGLSNYTDELIKKTNVYLERLYRELFLPLEKHIGERSVIIVPSKELYKVPFHALYNGEKYLIETRDVSYVPSARILDYCFSKSRRKLRDILLVGFGDEQIPRVYSEISNVAKVYNDNECLIEEEASFANLREKSSDYDILHIACHGRFRSDNPLFSSLKLADGWATVGDISGLDLNCDLVTLSACETGLNNVFAGDELLGLMRGFMVAGASSLLLTMWMVNDSATAAFMKEFYENLKTGKTIPGALRTAQRKSIEENMHPYFWAPFFLIGR